MSTGNAGVKAAILAGLTVLIIAAGAVMFGEDSGSGALFTIGCPNNIGGMIMNYAIENYCGGSIQSREDSAVSAYFLADCCAPKMGISLASGELQGAVMCPDSAKELVEKDGNFIIAGDLTFNTEVLLFSSKTSDKKNIKKIGYMSGQERQRDNLEALYGKEHFEYVERVEHVKYIPVAPLSLPYALELGEVDAAVLDFGTAVQMDNDFTVIASDRPTAVLVLRKDFYQSERYAILEGALDLAFADMESYEGFTGAMRFISPEPIDGKGFGKWLSLGKVDKKGKKFPKKQTSMI